LELHPLTPPEARLPWEFQKRRPAMQGPNTKEATTSFLKKAAKNFCPVRDSALTEPQPPVNKSFLLLFFKKEALASSRSAPKPLKVL
jgi:hypothetical protein